VLRLADLPQSKPGSSLDESALIGRWENADPHAWAPAIRRAELRRHEGRLRLSMIGVDAFAWGWADIDHVFATGPTGSLAVGLTASFELASRRARVQGNIKLGVMVLAAFIHFEPGAARRPLFTRDFLYHPSQPAANPQAEEASR
jgi:hypothetical protein